MTGVRAMFAVIACAAAVVYGSYVAAIIPAFFPTPVVAPSPEAQADYEHALAAIRVPGNEKEAFNWLQKAAGLGHAEAQFMLGKVCFLGVFGQDYRQSYTWLSLAVANHHPKAAALRYEVGAFLSPAEIVAAKADIESLRREAAR